jgi:hypothetical protein
MDCVPPVAPEEVTEAGLKADYAAEIRLSYTAYFDAADRYLRCLASAQSTVTAEVNAAIAAWQRLPPSPSGN